MLLRLLRHAFSRRAPSDPDAAYRAADRAAQAGRPVEALAELDRAVRAEFGLASGNAAAGLGALLELVWAEAPARWQCRLEAFTLYGRLLARSGFPAEALAACVGAVARRDLARYEPGRCEAAVDATLRLLDFRHGTDPARARTLMERLVLPWMRWAAGSGRFALALTLERHAYAAYVIQTESEQHFRDAFASWVDLMRAAGRRAAAGFAPLAPAPRREPPRVGFYLPSGNLMAHTEVVFEFFDALRELEPAPLAPYLFHRGTASPGFARRVAELGVPCRALVASDAPALDYEALLALRRASGEAGLDAMVWVSVALHMAFAFAMRVAPVQLWWALKYHRLEFPEIDGYLTSGSAGSTKRIGGKLWRSAPLAVSDWYDPAREADARVVRARYPQHELLFACLGREEKLNSEPFLAAVAAVLRACPEAGFLWTGRERLHAIQARLEALGVAGRCHYVGWIDTRTYAQVMDVFLDSFPFPCAFTLYQAMAAGKPVVVFASAEAAETGLHGMLGTLLAGESGSPGEQARAREIFGTGADSHYFCGDTPARYVAAAVRLARDPALRAAAGDAGRRFVAEFLSDRGAMARTLSRHLRELIEAAPRPPAR